MPPLLIVSADDFNLTEGVTRGILEAHERGIVTSTSVMVNLPGLERSRDLALHFPRLDLGLHINLTLGPPVLPAGRVASLVDGTGHFIRDHEHPGEAGEVSEIRKELTAQAERFRAIFGNRPSHLDSHHHVHRHPQIFQLALDLATTLGLPLRAIDPEMSQRIRRRGLLGVDRAVGDVRTEAYWTPERLMRFVRSLPSGITELICHPGHADAALSISSYCAQREVELRALCDPRVKGALAAAGIRCIAYSELAAILGKR